jgi:phosphoenolpyruvate carboxykinase (ATP)
VTSGGALLADTGQHTGRSPKDKFIVRDASTENQVWWDNNSALSPEAFATHIQGEIDRWTPIIRDAGIRVQ